MISHLKAHSLRLVLACSLIVASTLAPLGAAAYPYVPSPDEIYLRARERQARFRVPLFVHYTIDEAITHTGGQGDREHPHASTPVTVRHRLNMVVRSTDQYAIIIERDGRAHASEPAITPETYVDPQAPSRGPSPFAGFDIPTEPPDDGVGGLDEYGQPEVKRSAHYNIELAGIESLEGRSVFHLVLEPRTMPERFVTRDMWIDSTTFVTYKTVVRTHEVFDTRRLPVFASLQFAATDGAWLLRSIRAFWNGDAGYVSVDYHFHDFRLRERWDDFDDYMRL